LSGGRDQGAQLRSILLKVLLLGKGHDGVQISIIGTDGGVSSNWSLSRCGGGNFASVSPGLVEDNDCHVTLVRLESQLIVEASHELSGGRDQGAQLLSILLKVLFLGKGHDGVQISIIGTDGSVASNENRISALCILSEGNEEESEK
jgi:hypothetical protein